MGMTSQTATDTDQPRVTNGQLGTWLGLTHVTVSRLRSGARGASPDTMSLFAEKLGWSVDDQVKARLAKSYHTDFETYACREYLRAHPPVEQP